MADTSYFDLYKALKADGAVQGDWNSFHKFVGAPGKQGYLNRKKLYDALKADGAVQSSTYEEFNNRLFRGGQASLRAAQQRQQGAQAVRQAAQPQQKPMLGTTRTQAQAHARNNNGSQGGAATQQPQTAAQRAMQMVGGGTDYMKNWQLLHKRNDQMTPTERMQANTARSRMQQAQKLSYQQEQGQKNANPISQSKVNPHAQSFNETMQTLSSNEAKRARAVQQRQDDATNAAEYEVSENQFSHDNGTFGAVAPQIDAMVAPSMTEADDLSWKNYQDALKKAGNDAYLRNKAWKDLQDNRIRNRQEVLAKNLGSKLTEIYSDKGMQRHIMESADKLNMGVEEYVDKYVTPQIMNRAQSVLGIKNIEEVMPKSAMEYVVRRLGDSILGTLSAGQDKSKEQIAREQEAMAISDDLQEMPTVKGYDGEDVYRSGVGGRFVSTAANMMMDSPILSMTGGGANLTVDLGKQVLTRGLAKVGLAKAGAQLSAKQLGFKIANMSMAQKVGSGLMEGTAKGALNLGGYSAITSALGQASTGKDTSMAALAEAGLEGFKHGATTGAMFGASGAVMSPWISKFGIDGTETTRGQRWLHGAQKVGAEVVGLGAEAGTMMVADNVTGDKDISVGQWLEDVVMVGAFKAGEPSNYGKISQALYHLTHNTSGRYTFGKDSDGKWRTVDIKLTDAEKGELINSTSGKNLMDAFSKVDKTSLEGKDNIDKNITKLAYKEFMADPAVSQSTKEKVNAAMGLFNTDRKVSQRSVNDVQNKQILEYADDGTLLTRTSYKNAEQRRAILFKQKVERADMRMMNLIGYGKLKGRVILDSNDQITPAAASFLNKHGYDLSKEPTDANNAQLIADIKDKGSKLYAEWVKFADEESQKNMLLGKYILDILSKDPMKRTDEEMRDLNVYYKDLKDVLFPEGKPNVEQSTVNGQEVAEENNLGTEQPNNQAVLDNLHGLTEAENEMEQLMNSNDIFSDNFKELQKQGLTHPQIYDWLIQNGMTEEQLAPYAHYMNAVAKVQGMQNATAQAIEEHVGAMAQDWGFHGKMNGVDADGSQVLYVQDRDGRMLIVGSGEVAYDATDGHAKEGVGDMLVCLDPNTRETVYVRAEDTTLFQTQDVEDFKNEERQRLQSINSVPYNQAAQEQAAAEAAKPQPKEEAQPKETVTDGNQSGQPQQEKLSVTGEQPTSGEQKPTEQPSYPTDENGEPDFAKMSPEEGAQLYRESFNDPEAQVARDVKAAEKALKDAQKMEPKGKTFNEKKQSQQVINETIKAAEEQLRVVRDIQKSMTAQKVAETVGKNETAEGEASQNTEGMNEATKRFIEAPKVEGRHGTITLPNGEKISGTYYAVPAMSLIPSHDPFNDYKPHEGAPLDKNGRTKNDRDYYNDKRAQETTNKAGLDYDGRAISDVPVVNPNGLVVSGNGRTMSGQLAAANGKDGKYVEARDENAASFGMKAEDLDKLDHARIIFVPDEPLPYTTETFAKFNRNEKKTQSNTEQAVAKAKTLTADEVGSIVAEIEGNGSLDDFFKNRKAINDLVKTLLSKGIIGQNEVAELMEDTGRLSPQGKELVKNLLLGSIFKPETIRMLGIDSAIKNKAIAGIRAVMDNMKLGDYSLRDEIDQAIQLLYEARQGGDKVDTLLRTPAMYGENAANRYSSISQMMALALEGKVSDFRDLLNEYNREAAAHNTGEGDMYGDVPTKEELIRDFLNYKKWKDYDTRGNSEAEGGNDAEGIREAEPEAQGGNGEETERKSSVSHGGEEVLRRGDTGETETSESERVHLEELGRTFKLGEGLHHNAGSGEGETPESEGAKLEAYAKESGIWRDDVKDYIENELGATYLGQGGESYVYEKDDAIYKDRPLNFNTIHESIDNFLIAHELSPESGYEIVAVGPKDKMGQYHVVLRQKKYAMDLEHPITEVEIDKWFADRGFKKSIDEFGNAEYRKGDILVTDGIDSNFARDPETGKIVPIDLQCFREAKEDKIKILPEEGNAPDDPTNPFETIAKAADDFKKEHPMTEEEIMAVDGLDDEAKYTAIDYLNGEDDSEIARICYEQAYNKRGGKAAEYTEEVKAIVSDLNNAGIGIGNHLMEQTMRNVNDEGYFVGDDGSEIVYHGTDHIDLKVEDLEPNHTRESGERGDFSGEGVYFTPTSENDYGNGIGQKLLLCKLKLKKPFCIKGSLYLEGDKARRFSDILKNHGYDSIINYVSPFGRTHVDEIVVLDKQCIVPAGAPDITNRLTNYRKTDEVSKVETEYGTTYRRTYLLDGKKVVEVREPNERGGITEYHEYDGKRFRDLIDVADYIDGKDTTDSTNPMKTIEKAAADYESEKNKPEPTAPKTAAEKKAAAKKLKEESDKKTQELMNQFLAAKNEKKDGSGKLYSLPFPVPSKALKWMDRNLTLTDKQKEILPKLLSAIKGSMYARIKEGIYDLEDVIENVRKDFKAFFDALDKDDANKILAEAAYKGRFTDPETGERIRLAEAAERERKLSSEHKEKLVGDSKDAEERKQREESFISNLKMIMGGRKVDGIRELRQLAKELGLGEVKDTDLQELAETAVVSRARDIANSKAMSPERKFAEIKKLYDNQPSLNQRDSERIKKQQYSTPAPYAFVADMYVKGGKEIGSALEPSAGNGMLTIGLPMDKVHVNDIDEARLMNLHRQGFKTITSQDGTQPFADKNVDVVVTNPPFGSATPKDYDGYRISSLEGQMAINALESMKDDGRAAIIIGGKTEYAKNGSLMPKDKAFLGYLYSHYNVEDVINVDGSLYAKQGTSYPTRIILINGRRLDENTFPPVKDKARAETVKDYDELYKRVSDDILRGSRVDSSIRDKAGKVEPEHDRQGSDDSDAKGVRTDGYRRGEPKPKVVSSGVSEESSIPESNDAVEGERGAERKPEGELPDGNLGADRAGAEPTQSERAAADTHEGNGGQQPEPRGTGRNDAQRNADEHSNTRSGGRLAVNKKEETKRDLSSEKVTYTPKSGNPFTLQSVMPADQQEAVNKNLAKLGDADQFLVDELGYNDKDDLYKHLAAEQVDSVALAIHQAKQGNAFIIGDMTGIGKGRQAASLIRYAKKQGQIPVYFTKTAGLLSDVYRDLVDIGSPDLKPFVFGSSKEAAITDSEGNVKFALPTKNEVKRVLDYIEKNGKLPKEYDYVLTTYSQVGNGIYEYGEDGSRKEKKLAKGKAFGSAAFSGQRRRDAIEKLMDNGYLILDESHTAGGDSGQGNYFQHIIQKAKNVTFFSATFAKRPDNMPIYALRTAMNQGGLKASELIDAVKRGGATLQEIMSQTLTQCGQMIRRERDMTGVTIDWKAIDDPEKVEEQRAQYDSIIGLFNDIINFQRTYVSDYVENRNKELAAVQASMGIKRGTAALGIKNTPFASKAFNTVQQVLLSLKAKSAAERAVEYLKQGMKPVIALNNTNESQTGNIAIGEEMDAPDLGTSLKKGLEGTLRYTQKDAKNNSDSGYIKLSDLGDEAVAAYHELEKKIEQTSTGLSLSPIDVIKNELQKAGYKVGELTGRQTEFVYNDNGTVTKVKRADTDKKKLAREFNDGQIDALILNKSAATGISLHASSKFKDQRKRVMIVAQQQLDVNDEVQMRGRIDRTGQILRGAYEYVVSLIPAEQRLLMMFKAKLKSLDANTTSSQKSKFNEMEVADITNKYGDKVVREYMAEHLDLYARMADPFGWEQAYGDDLAFIDPQKLSATGGGIHSGEAGADASKLLGRMALLKVAEQEKMLQEIGDLYAAEINRLNEMGENDLEITELPLKAKAIGKEVWKQGTEPDGDNAFADNTYIEKVNMAILKKPMKAEEVQKAQEGLTGGRSWDEYRDEKKQTVKAYFDEKIADATQKNEERAVKLATHAKEKYLKDAKRGQKDSGMSDEQIEQMAGYQYDNIYKAEKEKLDAVVKNLKSKAETFDRVLDTFNTEDAYVLPADMNNPNEMSAFGNSYGRLIDIKITDNFSPNASSVSFATLDGRRKITFPISGKVGAGENKADVIAAIDRMTKQASGMGDKNLRVLSMDTANWNRLVSNESRKDGYIITGNLMQALIDTKEQGVGGQLVKYTTDTGEVKTGILMPDRFEPKDVSVSAPISSVEGKFHKRLDEGGIESVKSTDGDVEIIQKYNPMKGDFDYQIRVPKSQKRGGKYFLDKELMSMMGGGNFETRGNSMLGEFKEKDLRPVLARLSNLGVKVKEERQTAEEDGTHFRTDRGVQYSKTDEKDVKNSRIIPEDVDKSVSSQIEKKFDDEISRLHGDISDKPATKRYIELMANKFMSRQYIDTYDFDKQGNRTKTYAGLETIVDALNNKLKNIEQKYGISRDTNIAELRRKIVSQAAKEYGSRGVERILQGSSVRVPGVEELRDEGGMGKSSTSARGASESGSRIGGFERALEALQEYERAATDKAAAERARDYLQERYTTFRRKYGLEEGEWASKEQVERMFNDYNSDKNVQKIFDRIKGLVDELGTKLKDGSYIKNGVEGFYYHKDNYIHIDTDLLSSIQYEKQGIASTICHEMLHVATSDIIALYQKGHADKLTPEQVEAAKEAVDLFNEIKKTFKDNGWKEPYALTNAREFITELASPEWRAALKKIKNGDSWWKRVIKTVAKMLGFKTSTNKLDEAEKILDNLLSNFGKEQFDYAAIHNDELFGSEQSKKVEDKDDTPVVVKHVDQIAQKLGAKVNMVQSAQEITNKSAKAAIERGEKITGWYDEKTGEVHLYMPNIHDRYTAEKTIWHEVVGHKGMRELFGDENYSKFLRSIWYDLDKPENARLKELVSEELKYNPFDFENGIEEGIARMVEDGKGEPGFWNTIKNKVTDILHEIGYRIAPNTKDVKYLLWLGKNLQKNPNDPYWKMKAEAVRYKLDKENVPVMIEKDGVFYTNDGKARSFNDLTKKEFDEATDGVIHLRTTPSAGTALDRYHKALDAHGYMFTESYMDNMLSLKNLMQAIVPDNKNIADIKSSENPYILQNTMQGAMNNAAQMFERNVMKPLDKAMADVLDAFEGKKDDEKIRNFNLYMITKHGLERNRILYMRDTLADMRKDEKKNKDVDVLEKDWYDELANLDERLNRGDIDLKGYFDGIDDFIRTEVDDKFDAGKHDYSGIHAIQGVEKSSDPYDDAEAIASVMDAEANMESIKKGSVKAYWDKVKAATQYAIDTDYKNGLISRELHGHVSAMFNWYVPLRKYDEATAEDTYGYITEKGDPKNFIGSSIMRARGHKYLSETNVLAQIGAMGNRAINNGGQNAIKQAFARFIRNHSDNNLVTETSVWYVDDPVTKTTKERYPEIPEDATPDEVNQIVADFNSEMRDLESKGLATKVRRRGRIGYKFERAENKSQHIVDVMIAGKKHSFIINGNPRAAQALNGLLENSKASGIMKPLGSISRMMAQLCTSYNPEFVMRNIMRDAEFASSNVTAKEGARYGGIWAKYYAQLGLYKGASAVNWKDLSGTTGLGLFAKYRNGTLDMNDKVQRYFKEFMENGGETGWVQIKNMKEWEQQYKSDVKKERSKIQKGGAAVRDFFFGNLENLNEVAENIARFSTYCASRDFGRSVVRSTYDAKEVSVNFNRHGSGDAIKSFKNGEMGTGKAVERWAYGFTASYLRHCSMFFNAGIQSTNLLVKNLKTNPVGTSINMLSIPFALGALAALGNNALIASEDEKDRMGVKDPYGELPDYIRRNNLCIYKGGGEFITIPLAIELRAFYGLGDFAAGMTFSPNVSGQKNPFFDAVGSMSQLVPVMDYLGNSSAGKDPIGETIKAISPSAISPFVEWEMNSDWKGSPIERRGDWNENSPAWQRAYNGTPEVLKNINKKVNAATNDVAKGNEDMLGNGFLDMVTNPSMLNHFFGGVGGGAATFGERLLGAIKHGKDTETKDIPFVRSLLYTPSEQTSLQRTKSKWYNYVDEIETTMANVDRLKSKNVPIDKRLTNIADYYHFQNSSDAAKVRVIELAQKQMKQWKKMRDRATDTQSVNFANQNIDRIMMEAVDELDRME